MFHKSIASSQSCMFSKRSKLEEVKMTKVVLILSHFLHLTRNDSSPFVFANLALFNYSLYAFLNTLTVKIHYSRPCFGHEDGSREGMCRVNGSNVLNEWKASLGEEIKKFVSG